MQHDLTTLELGVALVLAMGPIHGLEALVWGWRRLRVLVLILAAVPSLLVYPLFWDHTGFFAVALAMTAAGHLVRAFDAVFGFPEASRKQSLLFMLFLIRHPTRDLRRKLTTPPLRRSARGLLSLAAGFALLGLGQRAQIWRWAPYLDDLLMAAELGVVFLGSVDLITPIARRFGLDELLLFVDALTPDFAWSPSLRVFWGSRWNSPVHNMLRRGVFTPLGGRRRVASATLVVFGVSGFMHAVPMLLGGEERLLWLGLAAGAMGFFVAHGLAVLAEGKLPKRLRKGAVGRFVVYGTFLATLPLYPAPLFALAGVHGRPIESATPVLLARALGF
jgi:hypothetical protein